VTPEADSTCHVDNVLPDPRPGREESDTDREARPDRLWASTFNLNVLRPLLLSRGLYPDDVPGLIRYAALGLTHLCWRNSVLEDWHAGDGPLSDVDMMTENARTSVIARRALVAGLDPEGDGWLLTAADDLTGMDDDPVVDLFHGALIDFLEVAFDPQRVLNCGRTLADVGGDDLDELIDHAQAHVMALIDEATAQGAGVVLAFLALKGLLACSEWFGSWRWPLKVEAFVSVLHDPDDPWWHSLPSRPYPAGELAVLDLARLRYRLVAGPEEWDSDLLGFCLRQGLGHLPVPAPV
jgi:hypothetical protein